MSLPKTGTMLIALAACAMLGGVGFAEEGEDAAGKPTVTKPLTPQEKRAEIARNRALRQVESQIKRLKLSYRGKRPAPEETYVLVGKVEMTLKDRDAKVKFEVLKGQKEASEHIVDYVGGTPPATARKFKAFARFADEESAQQGLASIRKRYDELQAYRAELMKAYKAASMCRT